MGEMITVRKVRGSYEILLLKEAAKDYRVDIKMCVCNNVCTLGAKSYGRLIWDSKRCKRNL